MSNHFVSYFKGIVISNMNCLIVLFKLLFLQFMLIYNYFRENLNYMAQNNMQSQFVNHFYCISCKGNPEKNHFMLRISWFIMTL